MLGIFFNRHVKCNIQNLFLSHQCHLSCRRAQMVGLLDNKRALRPTDSYEKLKTPSLCMRKTHLRTQNFAGLHQGRKPVPFEKASRLKVLRRDPRNPLQIGQPLTFTERNVSRSKESRRLERSTCGAFETSLAEFLSPLRAGNNQQWLQHWLDQQQVHTRKVSLLPDDY